MDNMFENKNTEELNSQPAAEDIKPETPAEPENTEIQPENTAQAQPDDAAPATEIAPEPQEIPDVPYGVNNIGDLTPPNTINYTPVKPMGDYKPVSRGLKYFAAVLAGIILLTAASAGGYFLGRSSVRSTGDKNAKIELAAKPAKTDEKTAAEVYEDVKQSVVGIMVYNTAGKGSQASGVFYSSDGYIVTNDHIYAEVPSAKFKIYTADN